MQRVKEFLEILFVKQWVVKGVNAKPTEVTVNQLLLT